MTNAEKKITNNKQTRTPVVPRTPYSPRLPIASALTKPSLTKQAFKAECDINNIVRHYTSTGVLNHTHHKTPIYGDLPSHTYQEAVNLVLSAENAFYDLPAKIRETYGHDPARWLEALESASAEPEGGGPTPTLTDGLKSPQGDSGASSAAKHDGIVPEKQNADV